MIEIAQRNIIATTLMKFPIIEEVSALDIFVGIIYTIVLKLLATISTTV